MCGLAGFINTASSTYRTELRTALGAMTEPLRRRGPDDSGLWIDEDSGVGFGFRRLAIVDLTDAGHQPMLSQDGQLALVFNGEIYNHTELRTEVSGEIGGHGWSGHSDTETLLACFRAWGVRKTIERSVGMFALALWDRGERRLHLARDRFGEKPIYYGWTTGGFVFGSELEALRRCPGFDNPIDRDALALYTQYAAVPAPYAIYQDVYKLEPGCVLTLTLAGAARKPAVAPCAPVRQDGLTIERYWSLVEVAQRGICSPIRDEAEAVTQLEAVLVQALRLQSFADVPIGAFLSGGVDSSVIVALMQAQSSQRVKTFTIGFEETGFDEAVHARAVARHLGTEHEELYVTSQESRELVPALPDLYSEPFADSSQIPTHLVSKIARRHVTVALSGDGGDELFGGYTRHVWAPRLWKGMQCLPFGARRMAGETIEAVPVGVWHRLGDGLPPPLRTARLGGKAYKLAHGLKRVTRFEDLYRSLVSAWPADAGIVNGARAVPIPLWKAVSAAAIHEPAHRLMLWDALTYLPDDILHKVDRASMGVSLETRAPFLDHRVAELAWRLPLDMKIRHGSGKWIVRQLLDRYVPRELIERPKMGFGVPLNVWLRGPLRAWAEDLLTESRLRREGYFATDLVRQKWSEHLSGQRDWSHELWCVLMFQAWHGLAGR